MGVILSRKKWIFDVVLLVTIIVMGYFTYSVLQKMFHNFLNVESSTTQVDAPTPTVTMTPTLKVVNLTDALPAPDFKLETLDGNLLALSDLQGQLVLVNFWATWCYPCRAEFKFFEMIEERYQEKLTVLAVNTGEKKDRVQSFIDEFGYHLTFLLDPTNTTPILFQIRGLPTTVFIDDEGNIRARHIGQLDETLLTDYITRIGTNK